MLMNMLLVLETRQDLDSSSRLGLSKVGSLGARNLSAE